MKNRPPKLFSLKGAPAEKLLVAALSFRRCKPGHGRMKLGWYDKRIKDARPRAIRSGDRASAARPSRAAAAGAPLASIVVVPPSAPATEAPGSTPRTPPLTGSTADESPLSPLTSYDGDDDDDIPLDDADRSLHPHHPRSRIRRSPASHASVTDDAREEHEVENDVISLSDSDSPTRLSPSPPLPFRRLPGRRSPSPVRFPSRPNRSRSNSAYVLIRGRPTKRTAPAHPTPQPPRKRQRSDDMEHVTSLTTSIGSGSATGSGTSHRVRSPFSIIGFNTHLLAVRPTPFSPHAGR